MSAAQSGEEEVCGKAWAWEDGDDDHVHRCRHLENHPGRHVCRCRSWQPQAVERMPNLVDLLGQWDRTTNPVLLAAAGQLRQALRSDGLNDVAEVRHSRPGESR